MAQPRLNFGDGLSFLVGAISFVEFPVVGRLFGTDLALLLVLITLLPNRAKHLDRPLVRTFLALAALWLVGQIATDVLRHSHPDDYLLGWAKISFTVIDFTALYLLLSKKEIRPLLYFVGLSIGQLAKFCVNPDPGIGTDTWKWGLGWPITFALIGAATLAYERTNRTLALGLIAFASLIHLYFDFRSQALICFITLTCVVFKTLQSKARISTTSIACLALALTFAGLLFQYTYRQVVTAGWLGSSALEKYNNQSSGDLGMIIGGRAEGLVSLQAIADSPLIGHGSNARDASYADLLSAIYFSHGYAIASMQRPDDTIPSHSHLFGAWVEAGVLGAIFWVWAFFLTLRGLVAAVGGTGKNLVVSLYCGLLLAWDIPFSPYASERRFTTTFFLLLMIFAIRPTRKTLSVHRRTAALVRSPSQFLLRADYRATDAYQKTGKHSPGVEWGAHTL